MLKLDRLLIRQGEFTLCADWEVTAGARLALIGPSGEGKTTLLSAIAGFIKPAAGDVLWQGRSLAPLGPGERPVSLLFQSHNLFPHMNVFENVALGLRPDLRLDDGARARVRAVLERVGLGGRADTLPAALSGGQAQRAALARVLLRQKPLLLLDEPFAALGPALRAEMLDLVCEIADETGASVLMVTHDPGDARRFADLVSLVAAGKAHPPVMTETLFADPPAALAAYLGERPGGPRP